MSDALSEAVAAASTVPNDRVTINPNVRFGRPAVGGISVAAICEQADADEPEADIAATYGLPIEGVRAALTYGQKRYGIADVEMMQADELQTLVAVVLDRYPEFGDLPEAGSCCNSHARDAVRGKHGVNGLRAWDSLCNARWMLGS